MLLLNKIFVAFSILAISLVMVMYFLISKPNQTGSFNGFGKVVIDKGDDLALISAKLYSSELIDNASRFIWACRFLRIEKKIPAGDFTLPFHLSNRGLVQRLLFYSAYTADVTLREGWTATMIASELQRRIGIDSSDFMQVVHDTAFIRKMGLETVSLEGYLFPETYNFYIGMNPYDLAQRMVHQFQQIFTGEMKAQAAKLGFSLNQIVILSSIIQGEIVYDSEAPIVSGVYHNRLKRGMKLQADPTIQYLLPDGPRRLSLNDLKIESYYNTYLHLGLPPGAVNNPGLIALKAALYPAKVPYLYFVARGDGYHNFNVSADEHLAAKKQFNLFRRQVYNQTKKTLP